MISKKVRLDKRLREIPRIGTREIPVRGICVCVNLSSDLLGKYGSGMAHHNGKFDIDESVLSLGICAEASLVFG